MSAVKELLKPKEVKKRLLLIPKDIDDKIAAMAKKANVSVTELIIAALKDLTKT